TSKERCSSYRTIAAFSPRFRTACSSYLPKDRAPTAAATASTLPKAGTKRRASGTNRGITVLSSSRAILDRQDANGRQDQKACFFRITLASVGALAVNHLAHASTSTKNGEGFGASPEPV